MEQTTVKAHEPRRPWRFDDRNRTNRPKLGRKIQLIWDAMLKVANTKANKAKKRLDTFTVPQIAKASGVSHRFVRSYANILRKNGYLVVMHEGTSPHDPSRFLVCYQYREKLAPQIAGGSGGGGRMGRGWNSLLPPKAVAVRGRSRVAMGRTRRRVSCS